MFEPTRLSRAHHRSVNGDERETPLAQTVIVGEKSSRRISGCVFNNRVAVASPQLSLTSSDTTGRWVQGSGRSGFHLVGMW